MQTEAAVLWDREAWNVEPIELDPPKEGEVLIKLAASGMCHSDEHLLTGDMPVPLPVIGGHEGAGVVEEVGPGVTGLRPGDHVVLGFVPACGKCPPCATGHSNLCDVGGILMTGKQLDGTVRHHARGQDVSTMVCLGTFAPYTVVNQASCVKILDDIPLDKACLVGCGVTTGWGSSVYAADVQPGDNVAVIGIGGIGASAVQGARHRRCRDDLRHRPGAAQARPGSHLRGHPRAALHRRGRRAHSAGDMGPHVRQGICAMGVGSGLLMDSILNLAAKRGRVVVTNIHPFFETEVTMNLMMLTIYEKQVVGSIFGSANIHSDIPKLLKLYRNGLLDLDSMITNTYKLGDINQGYQDMRDGKNIRGVLMYDS